MDSTVDAEKKPLVLIVDDERDIADMLKSYFEMSGYLVTVAFDGASALEKAKRSPDVILLDVGLPDIDGFSICRMLRDVHTCPIMFLTARVEDADAIDGFAAGADDYVTKPFSLEVLGARVKAQLARGGACEKGERRSHRRRAFHRLRGHDGACPRQAGAAGAQGIRDLHTAVQACGAGVRPRHDIRARLGR